MHFGHANLAWTGFVQLGEAQVDISVGYFLTFVPLKARSFRVQPGWINTIITILLVLSSLFTSGNLLFLFSKFTRLESYGGLVKVYLSMADNWYLSHRRADEIHHRNL